MRGAFAVRHYGADWTFRKSYGIQQQVLPNRTPLSSALRVLLNNVRTALCQKLCLELPFVSVDQRLFFPVSSLFVVLSLLLSFICCFVLLINMCQTRNRTLFRHRSRYDEFEKHNSTSR